MLPLGPARRSGDARRQAARLDVRDQKMEVCHVRDEMGFRRKCAAEGAL
jgi:hypothetical protein